MLLEPQDAGPVVMDVHILVVEDDPVIGADILAALNDHGMGADLAGTGHDALARAEMRHFDAVVLDRMLPGDLDGLTVLTQLRARGQNMPVLILSALSAVDERIRGLRSGGDDYLTKPFDFLELTARLDALLRRPAAREAVASTQLVVADLVLDLISRTAHRGDIQLDLLPREWRLLEHLVRHAGEVQTRAMLFEAVWTYRFDERTNTIDVHIGSLRRKLDLEGLHPLVHTVRGAGYVLHARG
jgi:two-component system OmpR family response regulator